MKLHSITATATILDCSTKTVRRAINAGELRVVRLGVSARSDRIHPDDLETFIYNKGFEKIAGYRRSIIEQLKGDTDNGIMYIVQMGETGPVKIGYSQDDVSLIKRIKSLQTASPYDLVFIFSGDGSFLVESLTHQKLRNYQMRGEWFEPTKEVMEYIGAIKELGFRGAATGFWTDSDVAG